MHFKFNLNLSVVQKGLNLSQSALFFLSTRILTTYQTLNNTFYVLLTQVKVIFKIITFFTRQSGSKKKEKIMFIWTSA